MNVFNISEKNSKTVTDNTIPAKCLKTKFEKIGKASPKTGKKLATKVMKNPRKTLEIGAKTGISALFKNPKAAFPTTLDNKFSLTLVKDNVLEILFREQVIKKQCFWIYINVCHKDISISTTRFSYYR